MFEKGKRQSGEREERRRWRKENFRQVWSNYNLRWEKKEEGKKKEE